jgi:DNA-binding NarL/FixJ family response regulator
VIAITAITGRRLERLSERQRQVCRLLIYTQWAQKEIGFRLGIARGTVNAHVTAIHRVLGISTRAELRDRYQWQVTPLKAAAGQAQ